MNSPVKYTNPISIFRAHQHLDLVLCQLIESTHEIKDKSLWHDIISDLVKEVVTNVDPNVKNGDCMDICNYVKIKIIPGNFQKEII